MDRDVRAVGPTYSPPSLRRYGKMSTVTQGGSGGTGDGMSSMQAMAMM